MSSQTARAQLTFGSPIGRLRVSTASVANESQGRPQLVEVKLRAPDMPDGGSGAPHELAERARDQILGFLDGSRRDFDLPLRFGGSPFQQRVLRQMANVAFGRRVTYGDLAKQVGDAGASRAVGAVCGANPLPLVVPCHRVVGQDGLGGFGGGLAMKRWLLTLEATGRPPSSLDELGRVVGSESEDLEEAEEASQLRLF